MRWQKATPTEAQFQKAVIELAELHGWRVFHAVGGEHQKRQNATATGWPDLAMVHEKRGLFFVVELKTNEGRPTTEQMAWMDALEAAQVDVELWRPNQWSSIVALLAEQHT